MWRSDYWTMLTNMLADALRLRKPEGALDAAKDFLLDRLDDALEPIARKLTGKASWDEMKENARLAAASPEGGASIVATELARLHAQGPGLELHLVAHSAGSVLQRNCSSA
jgi:alpha-beta hydrolase superfamily lysophospholipase